MTNGVGNISGANKVISKTIFKCKIKVCTQKISEVCTVKLWMRYETYVFAMNALNAFERKCMYVINICIISIKLFYTYYYHSYYCWIIIITVL